MTKTAHTPGPWRANAENDVIACDPRDTIICEVTGHPSLPAAIADARLIAAAPDLLNSVRQLVEAFSPWEAKTIKHEEALANAVAAIERATISNKD